ncbi:riboflavin biosynthesis protein RibF [Weissella diestrammenae]|uniref:Riboflavin biosynthesis protein n=1 Tax=Weissella diestrammenae TaxID=1162633 RepID=A0A7G9T5X1_9LACO|nr:riboflavin biosynthesis protein RibF [Weissella diestrammenae]MCM0582326.1 riboflavin biosynthesis protein RibF [Weissella diestrammenae]QNN75496.1 riboflavin biosynthesis protein RibF [Weissella diestrammenae]
MQVVHLHHPYDKTKIIAGPVVLAMGFFDGVHIGHRAVIDRAKREARARGAQLAVLTYNQHASVVFEKHDTPIKYLTTIQRKLEIFEQLAVDVVYLVDFTSALAHVAPVDFVQQYMADLNAVAVVAGYDHTFGPKLTANMTTLPKLAQGRFDVIEVPPVYLAKQASASTLARQVLAAGDLQTLTQLLTIPYETTGVVVHGEARGRTMGFPTLNIETPIDERLPGEGVYIAQVAIAGHWYQGMGQIGYNVTFGAGRAQTVEINLFDFNEEVYGEQVHVKWEKYLRDEQKFSDMNALIQQLHQDKISAGNYFSHLERQGGHDVI